MSAVLCTGWQTEVTLIGAGLCATSCMKQAGNSINGLASATMFLAGKLIFRQAFRFVIRLLDKLYLKFVDHLIGAAGGFILGLLVITCLCTVLPEELVGGSKIAIKTSNSIYMQMSDKTFNLKEDV